MGHKRRLRNSNSIIAALMQHQGTTDQGCPSKLQHTSWLVDLDGETLGTLPEGLDFLLRMRWDALSSTCDITKKKCLRQMDVPDIDTVSCAYVRPKGQNWLSPGRLIFNPHPWHPMPMQRWIHAADESSWPACRRARCPASPSRLSSWPGSAASAACHLEASAACHLELGVGT